MKNPRFITAALTATCALSAAPVIHAGVGDLYVSAVPLVLKVTGGITSPFSSATLLPSGVAVDPSGNLFAADATVNLIVKITSAGVQSTFLGTGLSSPRGLAFDAAGNLYVADSGTNSILKVTPGGVTTTFAVGLNAPRGLAFDILGNLYVANSGDNTVVKITTDGTKTTFVSAGLNQPFGLAFNAQGTLFVSNTGSNTIVKVDLAGVVTAFVSAGLNMPEGLAFDASENLFVADFGSGAVLKITPGGIVTIDVSGLVGPQFLALLPSLHQFYNISTRGYVQTGNHVLIAGLIIRGEPAGDLGSMSVLVRAIGPELTGFGINDALADPTLELYNASGQLIASNNDWKSSQQSAIEATGLAPHDDHDAAILASLPDGNYTAIVKGANGTTGTALVEAYNTGL
jgi:DNA-binding beta-propeller fold protein YncE